MCVRDACTQVTTHLATKIKRRSMATYGSMEKFDPKVDEWSTYAQRLKHYFIANGVDNGDKKCSILLTVVGTPTYRLLRSLAGKDDTGSEKIDSTSFDDLFSLLTKHYNPQQSTIVRRFHFNTRVRAQGESIADYVAAL